MAKLRVWWIPQVPMKPFYYNVHSVEDACILCDCLARYDIFQLENNVKPDYANAGGLNIFEDGEWIDWYDEDDRDFDEFMNEYMVVYRGKEKNKEPNKDNDMYFNHMW